MNSSPMSFVIQDRTRDMLRRMAEESGYSKTDIVHIAIEVLAQQPMPKALLPYVKVRVFDALNKNGRTPEQWCIENGIQKKHFDYCLRRIANGHGIYEGDTNKWRAKNDDRMYKTHTAYIAERLRLTCGIDLQNLTSTISG